MSSPLHFQIICNYTYFIHLVLFQICIYYICELCLWIATLPERTSRTHAIVRNKWNSATIVHTINCLTVRGAPIKEQQKWPVQLSRSRDFCAESAQSGGSLREQISNALTEVCFLCHANQNTNTVFYSYMRLRMHCVNSPHVRKTGYCLKGNVQSANCARSSCRGTIGPAANDMCLLFKDNEEVHS